MEQDLDLIQPQITPTENTSTNYNQLNNAKYYNTQKVLRKHKR